MLSKIIQRIKDMIRNKQKPLIVLDPGHFANHNKGAAAGYYEGNWMLTYAKYLRAALEAIGFSVLLTRYNGTDLPLWERARIAVRKKAVFFYSLHSNACSTPSVRRVTVFYSVDQPDMQKFAAAIGAAVKSVMGSPKYATSTRASTAHFSSPDPSRQEDYYTVIDEASDGGVPVLLTEHDFHTNPEVCRWLVQLSNLERMAKAEADVILRFLIDGISVPPAKPERKYHIVKRGETLIKIGKKYGIPYMVIASINKLQNPSLIRTGQKLYLE